MGLFLSPGIESQHLFDPSQHPFTDPAEALMVSRDEASFWDPTEWGKIDSLDHTVCAIFRSTPRKTLTDEVPV
jgi:hypothetical protein